MAKKQILTNDNIETDIRNALKNPANLSRFEHYGSLVPIWIFSGLALTAMLVFQKYYKIVLIASLIFIIAYLAVDHFRRKNSIKNVSLDDYDLNVERVLNVIEEIYSTDNRNRVSKKLKEVSVRIMYFENGKSWNIPKDNYTWSGEAPMSDKALYQLAHAGDEFIVVTKKDTGDVAVAYPSAYFEYKS
ncbi:MAG: hypothetical protein J6M35_01230 [Clostridia bacterium]|nr:hypothetical protein [Clostridia bacterium]